MLALPCCAADKKQAYVPLPTAIFEAKKVFLMNSSNLVGMSEFSSEIKKWGRFQFVRSVAEADLIMELRFAPRHEVGEEYRTYDVYKKQISVQSATYYGPNLALVISSPNSILLTEVDNQGSSERKKDYQYQTAKSADRIAEQLRKRLASGR
jgi:hypothetical protein